MTDNDFAACIYCKVFKVEDVGGDMYVRGVLDEINALPERELHALEYYYRHGMTFKQTGEKIGGVSSSRAGQIVNKALRKLRHTSRKSKMSVTQIMRESNKGINENTVTINDQIEEFDFSPRIYNILKIAGFNNVNDLLAIDSIDNLIKLPGCGKVARSEIIAKMRECGYTEWANKMEMPRPKAEIETIGLSPYICNRLREAGIHKFDDLLAFDFLDALIKLPGFGVRVWSEIATKMREHGYTEWVDRMEMPRPKSEIETIELSPYIRNRLLEAGIYKLEDLLVFDSFDDMMNLRGIGEVSRIEIITKMREHGYSEWADKMVIV